jgi:hypothetical protein
MSELSYMVKSAEPWLVVVCTLCVMWLMFNRVRFNVTTSGFGNNTGATAGSMQLNYQHDDATNRAASYAGNAVYGSSANGERVWPGSSSFAGRKSAFSGEPPVFYPGIGEYQDSAGSYVGMVDQQGDIAHDDGTDNGAAWTNPDGTPFVTPPGTPKSGFRRNTSGFKRHNTSGFKAKTSASSLLNSLMGGN